MEDNGSPIEVKNKSKTPEPSQEPSELEFASDPEEISSDLPTPPSLNGTAPAAKGGKTKKFLGTLIVILVFAAAAGGGVYYWQDQEKRQLQSQIDSLQQQLEAALAKGNKTEELEVPVNEIPEGFKEYKNDELGIKFAYPEEWGEVEETPIGVGTGPYAFFTFTENENASFGGNGVTYDPTARDTVPTDCPGFLQAAEKFYNLCLWEAGEFGNSVTEVTGYKSTTLAKGFNTDVLVSKDSDETFFYEPHHIVRFNIENKDYYGLNIVLFNPTSDDAESLDALVKTIEIL